jgi:hypothetical protein
MRSIRRPSSVALSLVAVLLGSVAQAQVAPPQRPPEVIRGKVTNDSGTAIPAATVMITRGPDRLTQPGTTDAKGMYSIRFEIGTGDYLVYVSAPGFKAVRRRVQRQANEHEFVADFQLVQDIATLATVKVTAEKPVRATNPISPTQPEVGANERWQDGVAGQIPPTVAGDLNAIAGTMSNVTMTAAGPSILGSSGESNLTTLNGMGLAAGAIPRAARTETRVTGATFDPTRGGFAGANVDVRLGPGDRFYQRRNGFLTLDPPTFQFTDPTGQANGARSGGARGSLGANGELIRQTMTYNVALDVARSASSPATLLDADADALLRAGVSPDSVSRLIAITSPLGIPLTGTGVPSQRQHDGVTWLGRLDDTRDTLATRAFTTYAGFTRDGALNFGPLSAPSTSGERKERTLGMQLTLGNYVGEGRRILTESRFAASTVHTQQTPYNALPGANVLVRSALVGATSDVTGIALGGGSYLASDDSRWTVEGSNKASLWARADGLRQEGTGNALGSFGYNSIADFEAGRPASFTRTLSQPVRAGTVWNAATALAHQYAPSRWFNMLYGARLEADGFVSAPAANSILEQALGVRTGAAPMRFHVTPRVGFTYTYNRDRDNGSGTNQTPVGRFYRTTAGTIRGGIGEFRDLLRPGLLADAAASTGLPGGTSTLTCVGAAVPAVDWASFASGTGTIPSQCVDGSGALAERAPPVTLIDAGYDVPRSWRASLDWSTSVNRMLIRLGGLASYDLSQPGVVDANFTGVQRLALTAEGDRPVYVSAAGIDPGSGTVSATEARRSSLFGRVSNRVSDLRGYGGQITAAISPDVFKFNGPGELFASLAYTLQGTRRQFRGFDGAGFGDPREIEWAAGQNDARHIVVLSGGFSAPKLGTFTMFARAQSGLPFTPIVQGDVNGDGRFGDRAFIPDPATERDPALAAQMVALLATGSSSATECLRANLGRAVARNGCRGPWTQSLNIQWRPQMPRRWDGRVIPNVYLQNVLAGVDQALHGSNLRGWGSPTTPDPVLLVPRGFDAGASRFRYDVNPRFADTRPARTLFRDPFRIVIDFAVNLSTDFDLQKLRRAVEPIRAPEGWRRRSADSLAAFYLRNTSSIHKVLLEQSDSLFLSRSQVEALQRADSTFSAQVRAIYIPLGEFLSRGQGNAGKAELDSAQTVAKEYWKIFWRQPEIADAIVTPSQRELVPMFASMLQVPLVDRENSQWDFGHPVTVSDKVKSAPAASTGVQVRTP